jgi:MbtH protein
MFGSDLTIGARRSFSYHDHGDGAYQLSSEKGGNMNWNDHEDNIIYKVVMNHEEQYSIWPADKENALGWQDVGKSGLKAECLAYIKEVWTDMRPVSLRKQMAEER